MDDLLNDEVFQKAIEVWGEKAQLGMVIEEFGEVLTAINHYDRNRITLEEFIEEFVDAYIMMRQMRFMNKEIFDRIYDEKVKRIRKKLKL